MDAYVADHHPMYFVYVNGAVVDSFFNRFNPDRQFPRLTHSQLIDVAMGYWEYYEGLDSTARD